MTTQSNPRFDTQTWDDIYQALEAIFSKAEVLERALEGLDPSKQSSRDLSLPGWRGMVLLSEEIGDLAWHVAREHFREEWKLRFGDDNKPAPGNEMITVPELHAQRPPQ